MRSLRRNFLPPVLATVVTAIVLIACGVRPWNDGDDMQSTFFSLVAFSLGAGVITGIAAEFLRGARVVRAQTGSNLLASTLLLIRRNTRRYGGYIIHFGVVVIFIGIAGGAFNRTKQAEMSYGDQMNIGPYRLVCRSITQDSLAEYDTDYALLDVYRGDKFIKQLAPERRVYFPGTDHEQAATMVALHSTAQSDLYVVFDGMDPNSGKPEIRAMLHPLITWIWIGVLIVVFGTGIALVPNLQRTSAQLRRENEAGAVLPAPALAGSAVLTKARNA